MHCFRQVLTIAIAINYGHYIQTYYNIFTLNKQTVLNYIQNKYASNLSC